MTRQIAVDLLILIVGTLLGAFWCLGLARQSLSQVSLAFEREYSASLPIVRQIIGPLPDAVESEATAYLPGWKRSLGVVTDMTAKMKAFLDVYPRLLGVRAFPFAAVYLMGLPLVLAAWQLGLARQRLRMQRGIAPAPWLHSRGGMLASAGLILVFLIPGTLAAATALSFAWVGVGGVVVSASGGYLIGMHARRG